MGLIAATDVRERYAFWLTTIASYGILVGLATTPGIGYTFRLSTSAAGLVDIPEYNAILWLPAVLGAGAWGVLAWANTVYWIIIAGLVGKSLAHLDRRHRATRRRAPARRVAPLPGRDPPGRTDRPVPVAGGGPPAPPRA